MSNIVSFMTKRLVSTVAKLVAPKMYAIFLPSYRYIYKEPSWTSLLQNIFFRFRCRDSAYSTNASLVAGTNNPPSCLSIQESRTIDAIVNVSRFPLSIILVGVGDGPWDQKRMELYGNGLRERSFHNFQMSAIFVGFTFLKTLSSDHINRTKYITSQFVDFTHIMSRDMPESRKEEELALEVLRRIPSQYKAAAKLQMDLITTRMSPPSPPSPRYQICSECFSNITDMVFGCGHEICCGCGENKSVCPICQKTICLKVELERGP